jgi:hypothetical protein
MDRLLSAVLVVVMGLIMHCRMNALNCGTGGKLLVCIRSILGNSNLKSDVGPKRGGMWRQDLANNGHGNKSRGMYEVGVEICV